MRKENHGGIIATREKSSFLHEGSGNPTSRVYWFQIRSNLAKDMINLDVGVSVFKR
jgi:hypothetical protein